MSLRGGDSLPCTVDSQGLSGRFNTEKQGGSVNSKGPVALSYTKGTDRPVPTNANSTTGRKLRRMRVELWDKIALLWCVVVECMCGGGVKGEKENPMSKRKSREEG